MHEIKISIHASRVGGDCSNDFVTDSLCLISIHASRVGGDTTGYHHIAATCISIHASRVGGDFRPPVRAVYFYAISIHASRVGGDSSAERPPAPPRDFNPRLPGGRRLA